MWSHLSADGFPRGSNGSVMVDAIQSSIELRLLFTRENEVFRLETSPEVIDQLELLVRGESSKIDCRLGHRAILAHQVELAKSPPTRILALANVPLLSCGRSSKPKGSMRHDRARGTRPRAIETSCPGGSRQLQ